MHKRIRKRIILGLTFIIMVILLFANLPAFLVITHLDHQIKNYIVQKMITSDRTVLNVDDISIGFKRITLKNVDFISNTQQFTTIIKGIELDYNIFALILYPDTPYKAINEIYFTEPQLVVQEQASAADTVTTDKRLSSVLETLRQINFARILIEQGRISFKRINGEYVTLANELKGWLETDDRYNLHINLSGKLARSYKENFNVNCTVNNLDGTTEGDVSFVDYNLGLLNELSDETNFIISKGLLNSKLRFKLSYFSLDALQLYGSVSITDLESNLAHHHLSDFACNASLFDKKVLIEKANGLLDSSAFSINAKMEDLFHPVVVGKFQFPALKLSSLEYYLKEERFNGSTVKMTGDFTLQPDDYTIDLALSSPSVSYNNELISNFNATVCIQPGSIVVNSADLNYFGFDITSEGSINLLDGGYKGSVFGERLFDEHLFFNKISFADQVISFDFKGNYKEKMLDGKWHYHIDNFTDTLLALNGNIQLADDVFNFTTSDTDKDDFIFSFQVSDIFHSPTLNFGYFRNPPFEKLTDRNWIHKLLSTYEIQSIVSGNFRTLYTEFRMLHKKNPNQNMILTATIDDILNPVKMIKSKINIMHLDADADLILGQDYITGRLISGDFLRGDIDINLHRDSQIQSRITIDNMKVDDLLNKTLFGEEGAINGEVTITGTLDDPEINSTLTGDRWMINDVGYYNVLMDLTLKDNRLYVDPFHVALNDSSILDGTLGLQFLKKQISVTAKGNSINAQNLFKTFTGMDSILTGNVDYKLNVNGLWSAPKSELTLSVKKGQLSQIPFENLDINLEDSVTQDSSFFALKNHVLAINSFKMINSGQYHFEGFGKIPFIVNGPLNFNFNFDGDIFSFLPPADAFFVDGVSFAAIEGEISGTPRSPRINKWKADIEKGELWLRSVANHIENIHGSIELEKGTNRINFHDLFGEIGGKRICFNTVRGITTSSGRKLEHWYFKSLDLDFGILAIKTLDDGIELHIPSLMEKNETGILQLTGRVPGESFYFAGPVKHPCAWGQVAVSDARITFPFLPTGGGSNPNRAVEFLKNIDWDVFTQAGTDLEYVRDIPALIGYVDTELSVDPTSEGLYFKGILAKDEFRVEGKVFSSRGRLDYLDMNFRVESFGVEFNKLETEPDVYGRAWTTVRDSVGAVPRTIYLDLYAYDEETNQESSRARWEDFKFRLSSADIAIGETQDEVLAYLGYTEANIEEKAKDVGGAVTDNYFIRPLLRPVERSLERFLGMDMVRFNSALARNLFYTGFKPKTGQEELENQKLSSPYLYLMESSEVTLGKYLSRDLYLTYTGQLVLNSVKQENEVNLNHSIGLEYRFLNNLLIELEYDREFFNYYKIYTNKLYQDDFKIRLRHSFTF